MTIRLRPESRNALWLGFGGVLLLMLVGGVYSVLELNRIQENERQIRDAFRNRNRILSQIRADLYLSGTYMRDYLLESNPEGASNHLRQLLQTRERTSNELQAYKQWLTPGASEPFAALTRDLMGYWRVLEPTFSWTPEQRRLQGYVYLSGQIFPRRRSMIAMADHIASINEQQWNAGEAAVDRLFEDMERALWTFYLVLLVLSVPMAVMTVQRVLRLEKEAAARFQEIVQARRRLSELSANLVESQETERRTLARELHDEVGQSLSAVLLEAANLSAALAGEAREAARGHIERIRRLTEASLAEVRNLGLLLRPSMLDDLGLAPALEWQARETGRRTGLKISVGATSVPEDLPETHKTCVYRVVQEALSNCWRHAQAQRVRITLEGSGDALHLTIQDDGRGFEPSVARGMGLLGMQERVAHLHGEIHVDSAPGRGALIRVTLPLRQEAVAAPPVPQEAKEVS